ncbi:type II toxin-antitoxin system antitoxin PrlF [Escherichia coli]|nr:type II toxin-antitoxin system antitoxin PrlF [Escherichia coli]EJH0672814.1 type II toxin-antitoxin system antitoxin PrlF [Escherichia coli]MDF1200467.1 type II toxin-antitoxin system antitoxin PrlF [Escherichia coli]HAW3777467.1 type II toxin-antitoxin system antitoxin PrlF [Escherichia coli]HAZ3662646.1 type II toxin-antitoxin system antitoxin PrlF [Escherichia coli]
MPANARSNAVLTTESKVTIRGQTTIPAPVREALKLKPGLDSIHYEILPGGQVFMCRLGDEQEDHTMNAFLRFLDADIQNNPQKTRPFDIQQRKKLVAGMDVNIDDEIGDEIGDDE